MYDENTMKKHIFWLKARRVFFIILFTSIGSALGAIVSSYLVDILLFTKGLAVVIVAITSSLFLSIALLITASTGKEITDAYWKNAVYKKLAIMSKKLDNLEKINEFLNPSEIKKESTDKKEKIQVASEDSTPDKKIEKEEKAEAIQSQTIEEEIKESTSLEENK